MATSISNRMRRVNRAEEKAQRQGRNVVGVLNEQIAIEIIEVDGSTRPFNKVATEDDDAPTFPITILTIPRGHFFPNPELHAVDGVPLQPDIVGFVEGDLRDVD